METHNVFRRGANVYFVGIKGTGVCALAELMHNSGITISGSDSGEVFYTDAILKELGIPYYETFDPSHIQKDINAVVYSAAYNEETNPELARAVELSIPVIKYPDALGSWSAGFDSAGIAGVHGKTTTTAMAGVLASGAGLPAQVLVGSAVSGFNGRSTLVLGNKYFIAETCEYRKHFLSFRPKQIVLTAVESDHQDFFPNYNSIRDAFVEYCLLLPQDGHLIYCADDAGACEVAGIVKNKRPHLQLIPYGFNAQGPYQVKNYRVENERAFFSIAAFPFEFTLQIPGRYQSLNVAAALALCSLLVKKEFGGNGSADGWNEARLQSVKNALADFCGSKRRSEIIGTAGGILFMDDYGHHPTAIKATLEGIKSFYPKRRLIISFMSHTYTRTAALLEEFSRCFNSADILVLHKIYSSAREQYKGGVNGRTLFEKIDKGSNGRLSAKTGTLMYADEPMDAFEELKKILQPEDLFLTMGAGNNWPLGLALYDYFRSVA